MRAGDGKQGIKLQWPYLSNFTLPGQHLLFKACGFNSRLTVELSSTVHVMRGSNLTRKY